MKNFNSIILVAIIFIMGIFCDYCGYQKGYSEAQNVYEPEIEKLTKQYEELALKDITSNPEFYYAEAYIINQEEMSNGMINVSWCVGYSEVQCFLTYEPDYLDEDYPYLLTMYSNGTEDTLDDEVAVIWQAI